MYNKKEETNLVKMTRSKHLVMSKNVNKYVVLHNERRKQILDTAKKLILEKNITAVTMSDIASACGISRQTLYKYFSSFDAVVYGIQSEIVEGATFPTEKTATKYLCSIADKIFNYYKTNYDDFMFICLFDVYIRTHKIEDNIDRQYRDIISQRLPDPKTVLEIIPPMKNGKSFEDVFFMAIHMIWGFITRMAVLGVNFFEPGNVTEEESLGILKDMILTYLKDNGIN